MNNKFEFAMNIPFRTCEDKRRLISILRDELIADFIDERGDMPEVCISKVGRRRKGWYFISSGDKKIRAVHDGQLLEVKNENGRYIEVLGSRKKENAYRFYFGTVEELVSFKD